MTQPDEVKIENKTIRIPATAYYKAVEVTGVLSAIAGHNYSLSEVTAEILNLYHILWYPQLAEILQNEKKRAAVREILQKNVELREGLEKSLKIRK